MSALTIFAIIFVFILIAGGWASSEYISHKNAKANKQLRTQVARLEHENDKLTQAMNNQQGQYNHLKSEYDKIKEAKQQIKALETEYRNLSNRYNNFNRGLDVLRKTVTSKKYLNNSLAKEIILLLSEHLPDEKQMEYNKAESSRQAFKRIKDGMGGSSGA